MSALTNFRTFAPEFSGIADADVSTMISIVSLRYTASYLGNISAQFFAYAAAHEFTLRARNQAAMPSGAGSGAGVGAVSSARAGDLALTFSAPPMGQGGDAWRAYWQTTNHGVAALYMLDSRARLAFDVIA